MKHRAEIRAETNARFAELYQQLNAEQRQAVDAIEGTVMVLAGPGTGKTQLLAMRIANILQRTHMDPWNILCVTFTESGVAAMRERLLSIMGEAAYYVRIHTFHSFCNEIIQEHPEVFAAGGEWQPLSDVERIELLESLLDRLPGTSPLKIFGRPYFYLKDITGHLQSLKQENIAPAQLRAVLGTIAQFVATSRDAAETFFALSVSERDDAACTEIAERLTINAEAADLPAGLRRLLADAAATFAEQAERADGKRAGSRARTLYKNTLKRSFEKLARELPAQQALADVYEQYQAELKERGRYDYEDMINQVIAAWSENADLLADYQEQFQYIVVDEYQDTNGGQNALVHLLGSFDDQPNICVVGDDKQSIYRFQGASLTNMLEFYQRYQQHITIISLKDNYRSQPTVLAAADAVISNNRESLTKYIPGTTTTLVPQAPRQPLPVAVTELPTAEAEDYQVAAEAQRLVAAGVVPREVAIIVRYHRDAPGVFDWLRRLNVPARLEAGENALAAPIVRQFLVLLTLLDDLSRDDLLAEVIHFEWLGLPILDSLKLIRQAGTKRRSLWSVLASEVEIAAAGITDSLPWQQFIERVAQWRAHERNTTLQHFLQSVLNESGLLNYALLPTTNPEALPALRRLLDESKAQNLSRHNLALKEFLRALQRLQEHGVPLTTLPQHVGEDAVRVVTAHKAKGLEFEHVFLLRVVDKRWGNNRNPARLSLPAGLVRFDGVLNDANNEDERRLFYVALTRAKAGLHLSYARHNEHGRPSVPSLFLQEIPSTLMAWRRPQEEFAAEHERLAASLRAPAVVAADEVKAWLIAQLRHYVLNVTHLRNYQECPRQFYVRNVLQVPTARTVHQALGTAVHEALREFLQRYQQDQRSPDKEWLLGAFARYAGRELLSSAEARDVLDVGQALLSAYFDRYAAGFHANAVSEFDFRSHGVRVGAAAITGTIDKIEWLDPERTTANVVDYKTGQPETKTAALKRGGVYHQQLVFYKLLCDLSPRFPHNMVSGEIDFVQPTRTGAFVKKRVTVMEEDLQSLRATIEQVWADIQALRFLDPATWCGKCEYCATA